MYIQSCFYIQVDPSFIMGVNILGFIFLYLFVSRPG